MWGKNRCPQEKKKKKRFVLVSKILKNQSANIKKLKTKKKSENTNTSDCLKLIKKPKKWN